MTDPALILQDTGLARLVHHHVSLRHLDSRTRLELRVISVLLYQGSLTVLDLRLVLFDVDILLLNAVESPLLRLLDLLHHARPRGSFDRRAVLSGR